MQKNYICRKEGKIQQVFGFVKFEKIIRDDFGLKSQMGGCNPFYAFDNIVLE